MPEKGKKDAGTDSLSSLDTSTEVTEKDQSEGERRRAGHEIEEG